MAQQRPWGLTIISSLLVVIGGFSTLVIFIEMIDSIRFFGLSSIGVTSLMSFVGFLIYGLTPVLFYSAGISLFMSRSWARLTALYVLPVVSFLFFMNATYHRVLLESPYQITGYQHALVIHFAVFAKMIVLYLLVFSPIEYYLTRPRVVTYFSAE